MTDDPNKRQDEPSEGDGISGQQSGPQYGNIDEGFQKRPSQGGTEADQDGEKQDQGEQRRAS